MSFEGQTQQLDYAPCHYGECRVAFRGPAAPLDEQYSVIIGGSEVFGRYVKHPFSRKLGTFTERNFINMGVMNAGIDVFLNDDAILEILEQAEIVVVQAVGAHNMSNRFYTVHPRRNDRFLQASQLLTDLYRDVDFSDFSFTRHMLVTLRKKGRERFNQIQEELEAAWLARMRLLASRIPGKTVLLHIEGHDHGLGPEPSFVSRSTIDAVAPSFGDIVQCDIADSLEEERLDRMVFPEVERASVLRMLPPAAHDQIALDLARALRRPGDIAA